MKLNPGIVSLVAGLLLVSPAGGLAQEDASGCKDHPSVSRYTGSNIRNCAARDFDEYELPLGKQKYEQGKRFLEKSQHLEGKIVGFYYDIPKGRSVLEVFRNYEMALAKAGFATLFSCKDADCGVSGELPNKRYWSAPEYLRRYLAAKLARPEGDVYVSVYVASQGVGYSVWAEVDVIEVKPMEAGLVTVDAAALAGDIARTGHVAVYGIYFDTGKAEVKPESEAALREIAKLLQANPNLKLYVVGHTDSVGSRAMNLDLSRRRANAVVQALTTKHGMAAARLEADGVGPLSPVASNDIEEGRAKNRRVELVKQ